MSHQSRMFRPELESLKCSCLQPSFAQVLYAGVGRRKGCNNLAHGNRCFLDLFEKARFPGSGNPGDMCGSSSKLCEVPNHNPGMPDLWATRQAEIVREIGMER